MWKIMDSIRSILKKFVVHVEVSDIEVNQPCTDKEEIILNCTEHLDL